MCSGKTAVTFLVVSIIVLFGISCFLMSTVNPKRLPAREDKVNIRKNMWTKFFYPRVALTTLKDGDSLIPFYRYALNKTDDNENEYDISEQEMPPTTLVNVTEGNVTNEDTIGKNVANVSEIIRALIKRRSIGDSFNQQDLNKFYRFDEDVAGNTGIINVRVLDEVGRPRVEIKLNTNRYLNRKERLSLEVSGNKTHETIDLDDNTDIRIMPNDTIVVQSGLGNDFYNISGSVKLSRDLVNRTEVTANSTVVIENKNNTQGNNRITGDEKVSNKSKDTINSKMDINKPTPEAKNTSHNDGIGVIKVMGSIKDNKRLKSNETKVKNVTNHFTVTKAKTLQPVISTVTKTFTKSKFFFIDITNTSITTQKPNIRTSEKKHYKLKKQISTSKNKLKIIDDTTSVYKLHKVSPNFHGITNHG